MQWRQTTLAVAAACMALAATETAFAPYGGDWTDCTFCPVNRSLVFCRVYALFDQQGDQQDRLMYVATGADNCIETNAPGGFFQHEMGGDTAPSEELIDLYPDLAYDTFVTIGRASAPKVTPTTRLRTRTSASSQLRCRAVGT